MRAKTSPPKATKPSIPPGDSVWQTYSAHYELPLAGATSIFLHGLIIGMLAVGGIAFFFSFNLDAAKPPSMDMVMIEGGGTGFEGLGGEPGLPGAPDAGSRTEQVATLPDQPTERPQSLLPKESPLELNIPLIDDGTPPADNELAIEIAKIAKQADDEVRQAMDLPKAPPPTARPAPKKIGTAGAGNPKGKPGQGGEGGDGGVGGKQGPGTGAGGPGGRPAATKQEIFAGRWRFNLAGDGKEHARKLAAMGVTLAIPDGRGGFFLATDLNRRPVEMRRDSLVAFKDAVKWHNQRPESLQGLARELQLKFVPQYVVLLLPKEREEKMADEEAQYARSQGRDLAKVQATWFDFRLMNGAYEPVVIRQE